MGNYMKKSKITGDIAVMDSIGVRTRAKTLALQRLQRPDPDDSSFYHLQLRSRRLVKQQHKDKTRTRRNTNPTIPTSSNEFLGKNEGTESAFGDNNLDFEHRDRSTRESTPCSFRASDTTTTYQEWRNVVPTTREIEEFFACAEQQQQRLFIEKYNFDVVNDLPLLGRYEWVELGP